MASLRTKPNSSYWIACFRRPDGTQTTRSTKLRCTEANRKAAFKIAEAYEDAYNNAQSLAQIQKVMDHIAKDVLGKDTVSPPVSQFLGEWLDRIEAETAASTSEKYRGVIRDFLSWCGTTPISGLNRERLTAYRTHLSKSHATSTVNNTLKILRQAFKDAIRDGLLSDNPADIRPLKDRGDSVEKQPFTEAELAAMWKAADGETTWQGMLMLGLYTGQRIADLATLRWKQVHLEKEELQITTGKTKRRQLILMAPPLLDWIHSNLTPSNASDDLLFPEFKLVLAHKRPSSWLSNNFRKRVMTPANVGLPIPGQRVNPKSFHSLRHTLPSLLAETGVSQQTIAEIVGHDSMAMSWHYTHVSRNEVQKAIESIRNPFGP